MGRNSLGRAARKKGRHTSEDMQKGIRLCLNGVSIRKAAKDCNLPYPTLRRYMLKYKQDPSIRLEPNYEVNKIFTTEQENSIKEYILDCADKFYGLTTKDCRRIAYQMAHINKIEIPDTWKTLEMAGRDWMRGFRKRHPQLSVKKPEACSIARATAFNRVNVQKFFDNLKEVMSRHSSFGNGSRLYNLDETSTTTVQRPQKVLAAKGRGVCKVTSGERGVLVTTCCIVNAIGQALPPALVFPRKIFKSHMLTGAPPGTLGLASPSGWMNSELFVDVMRHFIQYSSASKDNPALLIMDNHESHLSIPALDLAKASGVTILTLHPHTTAKLQPLDVGLHAPFKAYYNSAVDSWLLRNPGKPLTIYNVAECVGVAYMKAMTPTNITHAFKKCGIFPFEDQVFSEIDFLPSAVSDRPAPDNPNGDYVDSDVTAVEEPSISPPNSPSLLNTCVEDEPMERVFLPASEISEKPVTSDHSLRITAKDSLSEHSEKNMVKHNKGFDRPYNLPASETASLAVAHPNISTVSAAENMMTKEASPPCASNFISPKIFRPPLKAGPRTSTRTKRRTGRSIIATDTPEKNALEEAKLNKRNKKRVKSVKVDLFKQKRKKIKSDSSGDEDEEFKFSGSSSGGEDFVNESDEEEIVLDRDFPPLARNPRPNDYVIILFKSKKTDVYYIAKVLEELEAEEDCDYFVSFLKLKSKTYQRFVDPVEPDTAGVLKKDIKYILPSPETKGSSRRQTTYTFSVNMSQLNLRY